MKFSVTGPISPPQVVGFLKRCEKKYQERGYWLWAAVYAATETVIGYAGLLDQTIDDQAEVEVAYRLFPAYWGKGLGTEAAALARDWAFTHLTIDRVISLIEPANIASLRVAEKNGLRWEKETFYYHLRVGVYSLSRKKWEKLPHVLLCEGADSSEGEGCFRDR